MNLTELSSAQLKNAIKLIEKKDALLAQIASIDAQLGSLGSSKAPPVKGSPKKRAPKGAPKKVAEKGAPKTAAAKKGPRVTTATRVIDFLKQNDRPEGVSVKELSNKLGIKNQLLHAWYHNTGKKIKEIVKLPSGALKIAS